MKIEQFRTDLAKACSRRQTPVAKGSGVDQAVISRFLAGKQDDLRFSTVLKLWPFIYGCEFPMPAGGEHGSQA